MKLYDTGVYLQNGQEIIPENQADLPVAKEEAAKNTIAYSILKAHNKSDNMEKLQIKFDKLTSHDITFVGIIQTARASGLEKFPVPYVLTNCHNSLCAVGGTINEDDHMFGLTCAKKYGGVYVPPHQAVIHQFAREMLAGGGKMILGSDSHTRYGALGTMAMGEGGPELVKQLLCQTYDINMPGVVAIYLKGAPRPGVGPQDVALAIIGEVFANGYVKNKVMEFVGPGVASLSADFRIGVDVMTTETTCLSSIWQTDAKIEEFYAIHGRPEDYKELKPGNVAYYDGCVEIDLSEIKPMIDQVEHTPLMHDEKLISFCKENDIQIMAWGPLLRGNLENKKMEEIAEKYHIRTTLLCDTNHVLNSDYSEVIVVGAGADAVDYKLISLCHKGDIVVSQDYGVAAMALGKGAYAIHQSGKWYTDANIDQMLMERHLNKKARRSSGKNHLKGPRKRTEEDDIRFAESFEKLVLKGKTWNLQ